MTRLSLAQEAVVGVDTHKDIHVAVAIDGQGRLLGQRTVRTTERGSRELHEWASGLAGEVRYGVEGTGSYGAGLARFLSAQGSGGAPMEALSSMASASRRDGGPSYAAEQAYDPRPRSRACPRPGKG